MSQTISSAYRKPDTSLIPAEAYLSPVKDPEDRVWRRGGTMRPSRLWLAAAVVLGGAVAACGAGSKPPTVPSAGAGPATTAAQTALAKADAYSGCMRSHGVANFPDPVLTPSGGYGFRTQGVDPKSSAFQSASQACNALVPGGWGTTGQQLSAAQQQQWLNWASCIRAHGVPDFSDPTFSGGEVHIAGGGPGISSQLQSAMDACRSQLPSTGGLGG
jgi:hypothetical protein